MDYIEAKEMPINDSTNADGCCCKIITRKRDGKSFDRDTVIAMGVAFGLNNEEV